MQNVLESFKMYRAYTARDISVVKIGAIKSPLDIFTSYVALFSFIVEFDSVSNKPKRDIISNVHSMRSSVAFLHVRGEH